MDLILWRHADAVAAKNDSKPDFQRRLAGKGRKQAEHVAECLERHLRLRLRAAVCPDYLYPEMKCEHRCGFQAEKHWNGAPVCDPAKMKTVGCLPTSFFSQD